MPTESEARPLSVLALSVTAVKVVAVIRVELSVEAVKSTPLRVPTLVPQTAFPVVMTSICPVAPAVVG